MKVLLTVHHNLETQKTILPFLATPDLLDTRHYRGGIKNWYLS